MALSNPRTQFGIYSISAYSRITGTPYGIARVLGDFNISGEPEKKELFGGASNIPYDIEWGQQSADASFNLKEMAPWLFEVAGYTRTTSSSESGGSVAIANYVGSSVSGSGGISGIAVNATYKANLKDAVYFAVCTAATKLKIYAASDLKFQNGTDLAFVDDTMIIHAGEITLSTGANSSDTWETLGLTATGGGSVAMTTGDVAKITVKAINAGASTYAYTSTSTPIECGLYCYSQAKSDGSFVSVHIPRATIANIPIVLKEKDFFTTDVKVGIKYDSTAGYAFKIFHTIY
jgi:hypothetical protein